MKQINYPSKEDWDEILARPVIENKLLNKQVGKILSEVKAEGDKSLKKFAKKFDSVNIKSIQVEQQEIDQAEINALGEYNAFSRPKRSLKMPLRSVFLDDNVNNYHI
jgi:histidinol dehydrogenase